MVFINIVMITVISDISCIKCPRDRTLIAKVGVSRVMLQPPRLQTCSGRKAPRDFKFVTKYGPKLGTLIESGVYIIIGHIVYQNQVSVPFCNK